MVMSNAIILGWYGTETLGDRAILDGILYLLSKSKLEVNDVTLASLYPFFTQRTMLEDENFYKNNSGIRSITIVDELDRAKTKSLILKQDIVVMGGGPVMGIGQLSLISEYFSFAKKKNITTILFGVGLGPLASNYYVHEAEILLRNSDYIWFRDHSSGELAQKLYGSKFHFQCIGDPAIISAVNYQRRNKDVRRNKYGLINLRDYPAKEYGYEQSELALKLMTVLKPIIEDKDVLLLPMHSFEIGGDDRRFLFNFFIKGHEKKYTLPDRPFSLIELYQHIQSADFCVGMRYHAIVLETILNGNNYIIDYTDPQHGKIMGFLKQYDLLSQYSKRYVNIQYINENTGFELENNRIEVNIESLSRIEDLFLESINNIQK